MIHLIRYRAERTKMNGRSNVIIGDMTNNAARRNYPNQTATIAVAYVSALWSWLLYCTLDNTKWRMVVAELHLNVVVADAAHIAAAQCNDVAGS